MSLGRTCVMDLAPYPDWTYGLPSHAPPHAREGIGNLPKLEFFNPGVIETDLTPV